MKEIRVIYWPQRRLAKTYISSYIASAQFSKCLKLWNTKGISTSTRLKLYNALVIPVLMYNSGTWALTKGESDLLDRFHRKQLKYLFGIKWPVKISNEALYKKCGITEPLSVTVGRRRWSLFGHILRLNEESPARKVMKLYFQQRKARRGRPINTLPRLLWVEAGKIIKVPTLDRLEKIAEDRKGWWEFTEKVISKSYGIQGKKGRKAKVAACAGNRKEYVACSGESVVTARF